ncbi:MAG TPA: DUF1565 domain-containing protein [Candidatus Polarisedimenticolaceae bacterium]
MRIALGLATVLTLAASAVPARAQCPLDTQTTDANDRTCFVATTGSDAAAGTRAAPLRTIQFAIDVAAGSTEFQTIRVFPGTYTECPNAYFGVTVPTNLDIVADDFITNASRATTILDGTTICGKNTATPAPVVTIGDQTKLRGFTIKGGGDSGVFGRGHVQITNNVITGNSTPLEGGGIAVYTGSAIEDADFDAVIASNRIEANEAGSAGGGVYVYALSDETLASDVTIQSNEILSNVVRNGTDLDAIYGGGLAVFTDTIEPTEVSRAVITANVIDGNSAQAGTTGLTTYGGGVLIQSFGAGTETIDLGGSTTALGNSIRNNTVEDGYGGGVAVRGQAWPGATHRLRVLTNAVSANTSDLGGGGMFLLALTLDVNSATTLQVLARANSVSGNEATAPIAPAPVNPAGGGGIYADYYNERSVASAATLEILGNTLRSNLSDSYGAGAALYSRAYNSSLLDTDLAPATSTITFKNNLVVLNDAKGPVPGGVREGGGVYAVGVGSGLTGTANLDLHLNTFGRNLVDAGGGGGLSLEGITTPDTNGAIGSVNLEVENSIFLLNDAYGIGGPAVPGFTNVAASIRYNDFFGNAQAPISPNLETSATNSLTVDPELDVNYLAPFCSPTIDAGDPSSGTFVDGKLQEEAQPNARRANLGHTGLTSSATVTLPDVDGSGRVDGVDVLELAFRFASSSSQARYHASSDRDGDGDVDGEDLSYVAAYFGRTCP